MRGRAWIAGSVLAALSQQLAFAQPEATGEAPAQTTERGVVAKVNGEPIYFEDLERQLNSLHRGQTEAQRSAFDLGRLMDRLVNDSLLAQEARAAEMQDDEEIVRQVEARRQSLALRRLEQEEIRNRIEVTDEELRQAFETDYATATLRVITADEREAADALRAEIEAGADFETLARERSKDPYAARGGLIEDIDRIDLPGELAREAWAAEPGDLAGPVRSALGWSILRIEAIHPAEPERYAALEKRIREVLTFRESEYQRGRLEAELRDLYEMMLDRELLESIDCERLPDGRLVPRIEDPGAVVGAVDDRELTAGELGRALRTRWKGVRNREAALATRAIVARRLLNERLMEAEAGRRGYGFTPEVEHALAALEKQLLIRHYLNEVVRPQIAVAPEEVEVWYQANRERFKRPPRVHLSQITVATEEEAARLADLLREGADIAWLAREHSIDRFRDSGGARGWMVPARGLDSFQDQVYEAGVGTILGPAGVPDNYVVLRVDAREEQGYQAFEEVAETARAAVFRRNLEDYLDQLLDTLRSRSEIVIYEDVLGSLSISGTHQEEEKPDSHGAPPGG